MNRPRIGIGANLKQDEKGRLRHEVKQTYIDAVLAAGGLPIILPVLAHNREELLECVDGVLLTGGDDIDTRPFGVPLHERAEVMLPQKQESDFALLKALDQRPEMPVLGICLGMQQMGVHAGCALIQHLHDVVPDGDRHRYDNQHHVKSELGHGHIASWHHQALADSADLTVIGWSDDGIIEAVRDHNKPFWVGVQWHPERTTDAALGVGVVSRLIEACRSATRQATA